MIRDVEVQHYGQYSAQRLQELAVYHRESSKWHALSVITLSLLPCIATTAFIDAMPLDPPFDGLANNSRFLLRLVESIWILSVLVLVQFRHYVEALVASNMRVVVLSVVVAAATLGGYYALMLWIGFPLPFTFILGTMVWVPLMILSLTAIGAHRVLLNERHYRHMINALRAWACQFSLIGAWAWPVYFIALLATPEPVKPIVMLILPLMKVILRLGFSRALPHLRDEGPEIVTFNTDVFSSLFLSISAQSTSLFVTIVLMILDVLKTLWSIRKMTELHKQMAKLEQVIHTQDEAKRKQQMEAWSSSRLPEVVQFTPGILEPSEILLEKLRRQLPAAKRHTKVAPISLSNQARVTAFPFKTTFIDRRNAREVMPVFILPPLIPPRGKLILAPWQGNNTQQFQSKARLKRKVGRDGVQNTYSGGSRNRLSFEEGEFVERTQRFLHEMEFVVLLNFIEAAVPLVYGLYVMITLALPNRKYYAQFADLDAPAIEHTLLNLFLYFVVQVLSLVLLCAVYENKFKISGLKHISFVLARQWVGVQTKLVFWMFYNAQTSLAHCGHDYTFKFAWL